MENISVTCVSIMIISYLAGEVLNAAKLSDNWIPATVGIVGAVLGVVGMYVIPDCPASDIMSAISVGIVSSWSATGLDQTIRQRVKAKTEGSVWFELLYPMPSTRSIGWFSGEFYFGIDFANHINGEVIVNFLMFLPFGILHPLSKANSSWKNTVLIGFVSVLVIEVFQPVVGRQFDLNDVILNTWGIVLSTTIFIGVKKIINKKQNK